jgi:hypothetical protein
MVIVDFISVDFTSTNCIPHFGHLPGLSEITSGCILQVYFTVDAIILVVSITAVLVVSIVVIILVVSVVTFAVVSAAGTVAGVLPEQAVNVVTKIATAEIMITLFICFGFMIKN